VLFLREKAIFTPKSYWTAQEFVRILSVERRTDKILKRVVFDLRLVSKFNFFWKGL
jgi:hypothetical protein